MTSELSNPNPYETEFDNIGANVFPGSYQRKVAQLLTHTADKLSHFTKGKPKIEVGLVKSSNQMSGVVVLGVLPPTDFTDSLWDIILDDTADSNESSKEAFTYLFESDKQVEQAFSEKTKELDLPDVALHILRERKGKEIELKKTLKVLVPSKFHYLGKKGKKSKGKIKIKSLYSSEV